MTLDIPYRVSETFIQEHPDWIFVYGCDVVGKGILGQTWSCGGGKPNCFGVPTLYKFCASGAVYFQDSRKEEQWEYIINAFLKIPTDRGPVIPLRKIGMGCARMPEFAPRMLAELQRLLKGISADIRWVFPNDQFRRL